MKGNEFNAEVVNINYESGMCNGQIKRFQKENYIPRSVVIDVYLNVYSPDKTRILTRVVSHTLPIHTLFEDDTVREWIYDNRDGVPVSDLDVVDAITGDITENTVQALSSVYESLGFEVHHITVDFVSDDDDEGIEEIKNVPEIEI